MRILEYPAPADLDAPRADELQDRLDLIRRNPGPYDREIDLILHALGRERTGPILEIGPGMGIQLFELRSRGYDVCGTDTVKENVELLSRLSQLWSPGLEIRYGDVTRLDYDDDRFTGIYAFHVWEHVHDQIAGLRECARVLKPGGRLLIVDGNFLDPLSVKEIFLDRAIRKRDPLSGIRWLLGKRRVVENFGIGWKGKDEDVKSVFWWARALRRIPELRAMTITTTTDYRRRMAGRMGLGPLYPFAGRVVVVAEKRASEKKV